MIVRTCLCLSIMAAGLALRRFGLGLGLPPLFVKYGGSALWATMVFFLVAIAAANLSRRNIVMIAGSMAVGVELFRLVHEPWLDAFRLTMAGAAAWPRVLAVEHARLWRRDHFGNAARSFRNVPGKGKGAIAAPIAPQFPGPVDCNSLIRPAIGQLKGANAAGLVQGFLRLVLLRLALRAAFEPFLVALLLVLFAWALAACFDPFFDLLAAACFAALPADCLADLVAIFFPACFAVGFAAGRRFFRTRTTAGGGTIMESETRPSAASGT
jgi:hypothetical protein